MGQAQPRKITSYYSSVHCTKQCLTGAKHLEASLLIPFSKDPNSFDDLMSLILLLNATEVPRNA